MTDATDDPRDASYLTPYHEAAAKHGASFEATLWANREYQRIRFEVFAELIDFTGLTIVDAGAGKGDFALFLHKKGVRWKRYVGLEGVEAMARAGQALELPNAVFEAVDFVQDDASFARHNPDVVVFSGSLNTMTEQLAQRTLDRAWQSASAAILFNFLSDRGLEGRFASAPAQRFSPINMLDWALERTPNVALRHEYLSGHDATIALWKEELPRNERHGPGGA